MSEWSTFDDGVSASTGATVTGLTNGAIYEFRVAAVNAEGQADWSNVAGPYTPTGTAAPTPLTPADDTTVDLSDGETFTWTHNGAGAQTKFAFRRRPASGGAWEYWNGTAWQGTEVFVTSATESVTFGAGVW